MNPNWIDFKELRTRMTFPFVLQHYGIALTEKGDQWVGSCPLPSHGESGGAVSFSAHPQKGIFQCFGCGAKGNVLDFVVLYEGGNPKRGLDVRKTALKFHKLLRNGSKPEPPPAGENGSSQEPPRSGVNEPLNFRLKDLDPAHPYLVGRGFSESTMRQFGVGYCHRGVFAGRIAIPLHDPQDRLIGYAGRIAEDSLVQEGQPKYLFPPRRETDGGMVEFRKSLFLYNGHRLAEPVTDLIVVEGFCSVWWLTQASLPQVVAVMGSSVSAEQMELILELTEPGGRVWLFADNDEAGQRCAFQVAPQLGRKRQVLVVVGTKRQPTDYTPEELHALFPSPVTGEAGYG